MQARQEMGLDPGRLATMFAECSLVMILTQVALFASPMDQRGADGPRRSSCRGNVAIRVAREET
jgi:hypothetical protein